MRTAWEQQDALSTSHSLGAAMGMETGAETMHRFVQLRWLAIGAQAITVAVVSFGWDAPLPLWAIGALLLCGSLSNLVLSLHLAGKLPRIAAAVSGPRPAPPHHAAILGGTMLLDVGLLSGVLAMSGGPVNPFSVLYLVHVMLAAVLTTPRWTWAVTVSSSLGFALLFFVSIPLPPALGGHAHHMGAGSYSAHLQGMWLAHTIAACTIAVVVSRLSEALRREQEKHQKSARLLGLAALAAGAAHEIGNPLGTIQIAADELHRELTAQQAAADTLDDLHLIREEVQRAKAVLQSMAASAGELRGEAIVPTDLHALMDAVLARVPEAVQRVHLVIDAKLPAVRWPREAVAQALTQLLRNASQAVDRVPTPIAASAHEPCTTESTLPRRPAPVIADLPATEGSPKSIVCAIRMESGGVLLSIEDTGDGLDPTTLARVGEPFFTTRPDAGMGLGVFVARSLIERLGGRLTLQSQRGEGTTAQAWMPMEVLT